MNNMFMYLVDVDGILFLLFSCLQAYMVKQVEPLFNHFKDITANWTKIPDKHTDQ